MANPNREINQSMTQRNFNPRELEIIDHTLLRTSFESMKVDDGSAQSSTDDPN